MSYDDNLYQDFLKKEQIAKLIGTLDALVKQLTFTNSLLARLVESSSVDPTVRTSPYAVTVTRVLPTIQQRRVKEDWL